ncbi:MAG: hypothetical protein ABSA53_33025 [Streptosporangiaceae bacterium]
MIFRVMPRVCGPVRPAGRVLSSATAVTLLIGVVAVGVIGGWPSS